MNKQGELDFSKARFNGPEYKPELDQRRLSGQVERIFNLMKDGKWRSLHEIESITNDPAASISAQLRHLRKKRFGSHTVNRRRRKKDGGLFEYQLILYSNTHFSVTINQSK
jgi:hypothetical protein